VSAFRTAGVRSPRRKPRRKAGGRVNSEFSEDFEAATLPGLSGEEVPFFKSDCKYLSVLLSQTETNQLDQSLKAETGKQSSVSLVQKLMSHIKTLEHKELSSDQQ